MKTIIHAIQDEFYAVATVALQRIHFSVGRKQIIDKYFMYKCMESSNSSCNVSRIISSMSGRVETMKRHIETMECHNETTKRQNDKRRQTDGVSDESNS